MIKNRKRKKNYFLGQHCSRLKSNQREKVELKENNDNYYSFIKIS